MSGIAVLAALVSVLPGAVVLQPVANMYASDTADSEVTSQAIYGANVDVLEQKAGWAKIRTADHYTGWTPLAALRSGQSYATAGRVAEVQCLFAHLYREANVIPHAPLVTVPFETRLEVISEPPEAEGWLQVRLPDDRQAWVQRGDVAFDVKPLTIAEMLEFSKRFIGLPYTWGGTSSFGYDCSGLVQMLCRRRGFNLPRDSGLQAAWSGVSPVDRKDMAPGDLLYFAASGRQRISHTGIYLGDGKYINATTHRTPTVRIDDLGVPDPGHVLVAIRRVK